MRWDAAQTHSALIFNCDEDAAQVNLDMIGLEAYKN